MQRRQWLAGGTALVASAALPVSVAAAGAPRGAAPEATLVVEVVQVPAWTSVQGRVLPLRPGDAVNTQTEVHTGDGAALVLRMPDGSLVRLGPNTTLGVQSLAVSADAGGISVKSVLRVIDGVFRFATSAVSRAVGKRDIQVALRTATLGVRGTDFWAMSDERHDAACLFEGRVDLATQEQGPLVLDSPTAFWARFFDQPVAPVGNATPAELSKFLASVEVTPGQGLAVEAGAWSAVALATTDSREALRQAGQLRARGFAVRLRERRGAQRFQVELGQLASEADARHALSLMAAVTGVAGRVQGPG